MSKEDFIKSHSYVLTAVGLLTAGVVLYQNKDPLQNVIRKYINKQTPQDPTLTAASTFEQVTEKHSH